MATKLPFLSKTQREYQKCGEPPINDEHSVLEKFQRKELLVLNRKFRNLQQVDVSLCQKNADVNTTNPQFRRIFNIQNESEELKLKLGLATNPESLQNARQIYEQCQIFLERYRNQVEVVDYFATSLQLAEEAADSMVVGMTKYLIKTRHIFNTRVSRLDYERRIHQLEDLLYVHTSRFGKVGVANAQLRREIASLLNERHRFYSSHIRYRHELLRAKERVNKVVSKSHLSYEIIEETQNRRKRLIKTNDTDNVAHVFSMLEQKRIVDDYWKLFQFNEIKNRRRQYIATGQSRKMKKEAYLLEFYGKTISQYKSSFQKIWKIVNSFSNDVIIHSFQSHEENNFIRFRYNTDLNMEVGSLEIEIQELKEKNKGLKITYEEHTLDWRRKIGIGNKYLTKQRTKCNDWKEKLTTKEDQMKEVVECAKELYETSKAKYNGAMLLLGNKKEWISWRNLNFFLAVIEKRVKQLMKKQEDLKTAKELSHAWSQGLAATIGKKDRRIQNVVIRGSIHGLKSRGGPFKPSVNIGKLNQMSADDDEEEKLFLKKPFTKMEMKVHCLGKIGTVQSLLKVEESATLFSTATPKSSEADGANVDNNKLVANTEEQPEQALALASRKQSEHTT